MLSQRPKCEAPLRGPDALWHRAAGLSSRVTHRPRRFLRQADRILASEGAYRCVSDRKLCDLMTPLQDRFRRGRDTAEDRELAFALLREVAVRQLGLRPYREQIAGALALEAGCLAEMATGEGKTLVATMTAVLAGWRGSGCHVITANDYLAGRDAEWMNAVYRFCGLTVGCITPDMVPDERRLAYQAQVTYSTNKEVAADFLRDRLVIGHHQGLPSLLLSKMATGRGDRIDRLVQRGLACAIVDEADSVLIDEAATPLLISGEGPNREHIEAYEQADRLAHRLNPSTDYRIDRHAREVHLTPAGRRRLAGLSKPLGGLWTGSRRREELVSQAIAAGAFFLRDKHYVIEDGHVVIVDEFTGRLMPDHTWRDGVHPAIEAKEGLRVNLPRETHARISFQRFFRLYRKLSGMSGTLDEARGELWGIYRLPVVRIPTRRPIRRLVKPDRVFKTAAAKWEAVVSEICDVHQTGRPILIGTGGIGESVYLSDRLTARGLAHRLLNAVRQESEAQIIAEAGRKGRITVSTNMAGRGTDIRLGPGVAELGGLHVIATERFRARRIDRQLFGRCSRQGDPGSAQAFVSLEDELLRRQGPWISLAMCPFYCHNHSEISSAFRRRLVEFMQRRAEKVSLRMRRQVLSADNWLHHHLGFAAKDL